MSKFVCSCDVEKILGKWMPLFLLFVFKVEKERGGWERERITRDLRNGVLSGFRFEGFEDLYRLCV